MSTPPPSWAARVRRPRGPTAASHRTTGENVPAKEAGILGLQRSAGNHAVSNALQRDNAPAAPPAPAAADAAAAIDAVIKNPKADAGDVKAIDKYIPSANAEQTGELIMIMVNHYWGFFGPYDRATMKKLWENYGPAGLKAEVTKNALWWEKCVDLAPGLKDLKVVTDAKKEFKDEIHSQAEKNLTDNATYLKEQHDGMDTATGGDPQSRAVAQKGIDDKAMAMTKMADELTRLQAQRRKMLGTVVGFKYVHNLGSNTQEVTFNPAGPKPMRPDDAKYPSWEDINDLWMRASQEINDDAGQFPWLVGLLKDPSEGEQRLKGVADQKHPLFARAQIRMELRKQLDKVKEAQDKLPRVDWFDLEPIRDGLLAGKKWGDPKGLGTFENWAARDAIGERARTEWWKALGFELATQAAFVAVSLATAGAAPVIVGVLGAAVAVGTPAAQSMMASQKAEDLSTISQGTVLPGTDVVGEAQVAAQRAEATAKAIESVLNAVMAGVPLAKAMTVEYRLLGLARAGAAEQSNILTAAVKQFGPLNTATKTGWGFEQMLTKVGPDSEAGKAIQKELLAILRKPVKELSAAELAALRGSAAEAGVDNATRMGTLDSASAAARLTAAGRATLEQWTQLGSAEARGQWLGRTVNGELKKNGFEKELVIAVENLGENTYGSFDRTTWTVTFNKRYLTGNESVEVAMKMVRTATHEARHAEQYVLMVRRTLAKNPAATMDELKVVTDRLREDVIEMAKKQGPLVDSDPQAAIADKFLTFFGTKEGRAKYNHVLVMRDSALKRWMALEAELLEACDPVLLAPKRERDRIAAQSAWAKRDYRKWFQQYWDAPHEIDARRVENLAGYSLPEEEARRLAFDANWTRREALIKVWEKRHAAAEAALKKAQDEGAPKHVRDMRLIDVGEADGVLTMLRREHQVRP